MRVGGGVGVLLSFKIPLSYVWMIKTWWRWFWWMVFLVRLTKKRQTSFFMLWSLSRWHWFSMNWISINGDDACKNDEYHSKKKRQNLGNFPVIELIPLTPDVHKKVIHTQTCRSKLQVYVCMIYSWAPSVKEIRLLRIHLITIGQLK